jgi:ribosomal protein S18 acetylase RimI-like enzyme
MASDEAFLRRVYAGTREEELSRIDWDDAAKDAFLAMQYEAQRRSYASAYGYASSDVVLVDGQPAGRLCVARDDAEIRIVDIALLPEFRGAGVGTAILRDLLAEGSATGTPVTIHVERFNRALGFYRRLGFTVVAEGDVHLLMRSGSPGVTTRR